MSVLRAVVSWFVTTIVCVMATPPTHDLLPLSSQEIQTNIAINQMTLLYLLNQTHHECASTASQKEVQQVQKELKQLQESLKNFMQIQEHEKETQDEQTVELQSFLEEIKGQLSSLNDSHERDNMMLRRESQLLKEAVVAMNTTITFLESENEMLRRESQERNEAVAAMNTNITTQDRVNKVVQTEYQLMNETVADINNKTLTSAVAGEHHVNDNCTILVGSQGHLVPYQGLSAPDVEFSDLVAKNCIRLVVTERSWDHARAECVAMGGDLFVAGDLAGAVQYVKEQVGNKHVWVGVKDNLWLDGRPVAAEEWSAYEPGYFDQCGDFHGSRTTLADFSCSDTESFMCQIGTTYPQ